MTNPANPIRRIDVDYLARVEGEGEMHVEVIDGKIEKYFQENTLLEQPYVKDPDKTVGQLVAEAVAKIGENITVRRFSRFQIGA